jgi:hypothetical protein
MSGCRSLTSADSVSAKVVGRIEFSSATLTGPIPRHQATNWWTAKLKIGSKDPDAYEFLTLSTNAQQTKLRVETCAEYTNAINQGAYAFTTPDMAMESWFIRAAGTLSFMESAKPSTHPLSHDFLTRLPVSVLGWSGSDEETQINADARKGMTLNEYAKAGKLNSFKHAAHMLTFGTASKDYSIEELARGDVDEDGLEDALLFVTWHYREGSGRAYELQVFSKEALHTFSLSWQR